MIRFILSFFGAIFTMATNGAVMAGLILGGIFFVYGRDLPNHEQLRTYAPPTVSRIYSTEGQIIDEFAQERRLFTPIEEIPDVVKHAFISAEDKNFYQHAGFDMRGIAAAAYEAFESRGQNLRGASTIPQQLVKNIFLSSDQSAERKIREIILSVRLVNTLSKDEILEIYLNEIDLGFLSFGVTASAQTYFNKNLADLLPEEAAYLAALPKSPYGYHPVQNREAAIERRNFVLREMRENGYLEQDAYEVARAAPLLTVQGGDFEPFKSKIPDRDYFTAEIRRQLNRDFSDGEFDSAGMTVRATFDPDMQDEAASALRKALQSYDRDQGEWHESDVTLSAEVLGTEADWREALSDTKFARDIEGWYPAVVLELGETSARVGIEGVEDDADGHWVTADSIRWVRGASRVSDLLEVGDVVHVSREDGIESWSLRQVPQVQGAFMAMDVNTGRVLAMQGGFSYQHSNFNRATQATRQPGSAFKPFVFAAALDSGFTPATILIDAPIEVDTGDGIWRPRNSSNQFYGPTPLRTGIEQSRNLMTIRLAEEIGMDLVASYAERFGVYDRMSRFLANSLGAEETSLFNMVAAYAMFANGGERVEPTLVDRVQDRWGRTVYRHDQRRCEDCGNNELNTAIAPRITSDRRRVMDQVTAYQLTSMMQGVVQRGTAAGRINLGVPTAGKTGTTNDARDVWFVGFTSNIVAGCYIGYDRPQPLGRGASGGALCAPVFNDFMQDATEVYGGGPFEVPREGRFIKINRFSGERLPDNASGDHVVSEFFRIGEEPIFGYLVDGGFAMGSNLPLFDETEESVLQEERTQTVQTSTGDIVEIPERSPNAFQTLGSGGQY